MSVCLSSVHAQCRDISSDNQRALMIRQQVCFQCPLSGSSFTWTSQGTPILPRGAEGFANGTLVINSVSSVHLAPAFFQCQSDGDQVSGIYRLVEACKLHACMFPPHTTHWRLMPTPAHSSQHSWMLYTCVCISLDSNHGIVCVFACSPIPHLTRGRSRVSGFTFSNTLLSLSLPLGECTQPSPLR